MEGKDRSKYRMYTEKVVKMIVNGYPGFPALCEKINALFLFGVVDILKLNGKL